MGHCGRWMFGTGLSDGLHDFDFEERVEVAFLRKEDCLEGKVLLVWLTEAQGWI